MTLGLIVVGALVCAIGLVLGAIVVALLRRTTSDSERYAMHRREREHRIRMQKRLKAEDALFASWGKH
jgi:hypothetical protein